MLGGRVAGCMRMIRSRGIVLQIHTFISLPWGGENTWSMSDGVLTLCKYPFLAWGLLVFVASCALRPAGGGPAAIQDKLLSIGEGGGFSGQERTWVLSPDGRITVIDRIGAPGREAGKLPRWKASALYRDAASRVHGEVALTPVGDLYRFIAFSDGQREARLTWSGDLPPVDPALARLIRELEKIRT